MAVLNFRAENVSPISNWPSATVITSIPFNCSLAFSHIHKSTGLSSVTCHCASTRASLFQHGPRFPECKPPEWQRTGRWFSGYLWPLHSSVLQTEACAAGYVCVTQTLPLIVRRSEKHFTLHFHILPPLLGLTCLGMQRPLRLCYNK